MPALPRTVGQGAPRALIAIWVGEHGTEVGGSVTHASGILGGFRRAGFRIGLVAASSPPPQLAAIVDDVELLPPVTAGARISHDLACLALNNAVRESARRLAARVPPAFVYQRHRPYLTAGADSAAELGVPLALEWNGSEAWTRAHWQRLLPLESRLAPLLAAMERDVVSRASLVLAVSEEAAAMALEAGADPLAVLVLPNAVDIEAVDAALAGSPRGTADGRVLLGWVGSFGPWHGAELLVRALHRLPENVSALLIGEGSRKAACEQLAVELGVAGRAIFAGALPHEGALRRLGGCDVLVSPHVPIPGRPFFGSPTKLFEYMALGKPIVASDLGQLGEVLEDGRTARLVTPDDPAALADGIAWVIANPGTARRLGRAAREDAERLHTWERRADAVLERLGGSAALGSAAADAAPRRPSPASARRETSAPLRTRVRSALRSRTVRQAGLFAGSAALTNVLAGFKKILLARALTGAAFAGYAFAGPALGLLSLLFELGLMLPAGRAIARADSERARRELVGASLLVLVPIACAFSGTVAGLSFLVDGWFHVEAGHALLLAAPLALALPLQQLSLWLAQGFDRLHIYSITIALAQGAVAAALGGLLLAGVGLELGLVLPLEYGIVLLSWLPLVALLRPRLVNVSQRVRQLVAGARGYGLQIYVGRLLSMGTYNMDILLVAALTDARSVALYSLAAAVAKVVGLPMLGLGNALFPRLARDGRIERRWLGAAWATGLAGAAAVSLAAQPLTALLFSDAYTLGAALLAPLAAAEAVRAVTTLYNTSLSAQGRGRELRNAGLVLAAGNVALNFSLIPAFGAVGAAWASLGALTLNLAAHQLYYRRAVTRTGDLSGNLGALGTRAGARPARTQEAPLLGK